MHSICPPKFCIRIVLNLSWDSCNTQGKWKTKLMQNFVWQLRCIMGNVEVAYDNFVDTLNAAKLIVLRENDSTQCIFLLVRSFIDPTFCDIFVCGPLQFKWQFCGSLKFHLKPFENVMHQSFEIPRFPTPRGWLWLGIMRGVSHHLHSILVHLWVENKLEIMVFASQTGKQAGNFL